jgi:hypothetical protein
LLVNIQRIINKPQGEKCKHYVQQHEVVRKDVEQQSRFANVQNLFSQWDKFVLSNIFIVCVVLHNIIVEDEETKGLEP